MAADTAVKRFSAMNIASPWRGILPIPDGAIAQGDRQVVMQLYSGILAEIPGGRPISGSGTIRAGSGTGTIRAGSGRATIGLA